MQTYEVLVTNRSVKANSADTTLVRTSVGVDRLHVLFDNDEWLSFPVSVTFAQGDRLVSRNIVLSATNSAEWVAEATVDVPWEVIRDVGPIRITLQGTDSDGNHIITAKGAPLSVVQAGDVSMGDLPEDAPTVDEWQQAYAQAMAAVNEAAGLVNTLRNTLVQMVSEAEDELGDMVSQAIVPATDTSLGVVMAGDGLSVTHDGVLSVDGSASGGMTSEQLAALQNLSALAYYAFDTEFDEDGTLKDGVRIKHTALPVATTATVGGVAPDGDTIVVGPSGAIRATYTLPAATSSTLGGVMPDGTTIQNESGRISARVATAAANGVARPDGTTITIDANGILSATGSGPGGYVLPKASESQLGGVMVDGETLAVDGNGVLSVILPAADDMEF